MLSDGDYWLEIKAIIGGVLGFWGGVGGLGSLILVIVLSQVRTGGCHEAKKLSLPPIHVVPWVRSLACFIIRLD